MYENVIEFISVLIGRFLIAPNIFYFFLTLNHLTLLKMPEFAAHFISEILQSNYSRLWICMMPIKKAQTYHLFFRWYVVDLLPEYPLYKSCYNTGILLVCPRTLFKCAHCSAPSMTKLLQTNPPTKTVTGKNPAHGWIINLLSQCIIYILWFWVLL